MFHAQLIAKKIQRNVKQHLAGMRSRTEFDATAKSLWAQVSQGEMRIVGSACAQRHDAVSRALGTIVQ